MPFWLIGLIGNIGKHGPRIIIYGAIILGTGFFLYSAFLKPTNTTNIADGGKVINVYEPPKQDLFSFGCSNLKVEMYWRKNHQSSTLKKNGQN